MCWKKLIVGNKFLLGLTCILIPILSVLANYGVDFYITTSERNNDIKHLEQNISEMKQDIKDIHWHLVGAAENNQQASNND